MKRIFVAVCLAVSLAGPAAADTVHVLYENTLVLTDADGGVKTVLLDKSGKFEQTNARGEWAAGFWVKLDSRFCMTARGEFQVCFTLESGKSIGDNWGILGPTGEPAWTAEIKAGRADLKGGASAGRTP
jgi:hypothetical protein